MKEKSHVKTAIRWRPTTEGQEMSIEKVTDQIISIVKHNQTFMFDNVFDSSAQCEVYDILIKPLIEKAFEGFDCTFLASGQTGSGKTYTMGFESSVIPENNGMMTRLLKSLFCHEKEVQFKMLVSFVEIYNDQAFDLLADSSQEPFYTKADHRTADTTKKSVKTEAEVQDLLLLGTKKRKVRGTKMNSVSSRSHAIFTIYLGIEHEKGKIRESVINMVDLAGSEGFKKTGNTGEAHKEAKSINESLCAFKRVIMAMAREETHVPFRDAVITTILKDSLNKRAYLSLLGCVSPYEADYGETLLTLRFVSEAKQMKMTPTLNAIINEYKKSKTPIKNIPGRLSRTPSSTSKFITPFKRPMALGVSKLPKQMSEPRYKASQCNDTTAIKRKSIIRSTIKKPSQYRISGSLFHKRKTAANLFPDKAKVTVNDSVDDNNGGGGGGDEGMTPMNSSFKENVNRFMVSNQIDSFLKTSSTPYSARRSIVLPQYQAKTQPVTAITEDAILPEIKDITDVLESIENDSPGPVEAILNDPTLPSITDAFGPIGMKPIDSLLANNERLFNVTFESNLIADKIEVLNEYSGLAPLDNSFEILENIEGAEVQQLSPANVTLEDALSDTKTDIEDVTIGSDNINDNLVEMQENRNGVSCVTPLVLQRIEQMTSNEECSTSDEGFSDLEPPIEFKTSPKVSSIRMRFPKSPRLVLHRLENIEAYQLLLLNKAEKKEPKKKKRTKVTRVESVRRSNAKTTAAPASAMSPGVTKRLNDHSKKILNILNTGNVKDLTRLARIGKVKAEQIFDYRGIYGKFKDINDLNNMPFWSPNFHRMFSLHNNLSA